MRAANVAEGAGDVPVGGDATARDLGDDVVNVVPLAMRRCRALCGEGVCIERRSAWREEIIGRWTILNSIAGSHGVCQLRPDPWPVMSPG